MSELERELAEALKPFAAAGAKVTGYDPRDGGYYHASTEQYVSLGDYARAAEAYKQYVEKLAHG